MTQGDLTPPTLLIGGTAAIDLTVAVAHLPIAGETVSGRLVARGAGGKGLNYAFAARKLGMDVALMTTLGMDSAGDDLLDALADAGVDTWGVQRTSESPTTQSTIVIDPHGENLIVTATGASGGYTYVPPPIRLQPDVIVLQGEWPFDCLEQCAAQADVPVLLNLAPYCNLPDEFLGSCHTVIVNEREAEALDASWSRSTNAWEGAVRRRFPGHLNIIVTMGSRGVFLTSLEGATPYPTYPVTVRDSSGAGDSFVATYASALALKHDIDTCISLAQSAAALTVQRLGTAQSFPDWQEVVAHHAAHRRILRT